MGSLSRLIRRSVYLALLALVAVATPAQAKTTATFKFVGQMTLDNPLGSQTNPTDGLPDIVTQTTTTAPVLHCNLPLPPLPTPDVVPQCHNHWGGHTRTITTFGSTTCLGDVKNVNKLGKAPSHTGSCSFSIATGKVPEGNHLHGACELNGGQVQLRFTDPLGQTYTLDLHFNDFAGRVVMTGHFRKLNNTASQTGLVTVKMDSAAVPVLEGTTLRNTCGSSTARFFTIAGAGALDGH